MPEISPEEIKTKLVSMLGGDTTLRSLMGATASDSRVYFYYNPEAIIDAQHKAYITYAHLAFPEQTQAVGEPVFSLAIWAIDQQTIKSVRDRVVTLLQETALQTLNSKAMRGTQVGERDSFQENTKFQGKTLQYKFGFSRVV